MESFGGKILFVDDNTEILDAFSRGLRKLFDVHTAETAAEALILLRENGPYAVLIVDMQMPEMNGIQLLVRVAELAPDTVRVVLTADPTEQTIIDAVNQGQVFRFLDKPCPRDVLVRTIEACLQQYEKNISARNLSTCDEAGV